MHEAVIVAAARTAVGKAPAGSLRTVRPDEMAAAVISDVIKRTPGVEASDVDDVILGCAMPEAEQGLNVARIASLRAGIPVEASAVTINRFCSSGLQSIAFAAEKIMCGFAQTVVAGGTESMSMVPMGGNKIAPNPALVDSYPDVYLSTGLVAENHARESRVSRDEQDAFALRSHTRALAAIDAGRFDEEVVPLLFKVVDLPPEGGSHVESVGSHMESVGSHTGPGGSHNGQDVASGFRRKIREVIFTRDEGPRRDTSLEKLGKLKPAFH